MTKVEKDNPALQIRRVIFDWKQIERWSYVRQIKALKKVNELVFHKNITFFVGENGSGKSTLLEAIAVAYGFNPEGGTRNYHFSTYDSHSELCDAIQLVKGFGNGYGYFLRVESFYNVATAEEEYVDDKHPSMRYHTYSHGESFLTLAQRYFSSTGVFILDEPEAALSPQRQMTLLLEISRCAKAGAQFIIVTHSPILLSIPDAEIWTFDDGQIHACAYEETGSYQVTEMFLNHREQILNRLLSDDSLKNKKREE